MINITIKSALQWAQSVLFPNEDAKRDSELLLMHVLQCDQKTLITQASQALNPQENSRFQEMVLSRKQGHPTAYLLGEWASFELTLTVTPDVLIPRPETDVLIETVLKILPQDEMLSVVELGTGSGTIALNLASLRPAWQLTATDLSLETLEIAKNNAKRYGLQRVQFVKGDWYQPLTGQRYHAIVSNPPYIAGADPHLSALSFEPPLALLAGPEGLDALRTLIQEAPLHLLAGGWVILEHGYKQGGAVRTLLMQSGFTHIETIKDLSHQERVSMGCYQE
ncbi:MAG: prmC [Gammaproteobacteria bacterium]|jgi:release factor glutamine methyltransferase|nr:prmC [Gammaproteobacteria bacterium]